MLILPPMAWPFRNKSSQSLPPEVERVFDKLWEILQNEPAQVGQYPEPLRSQMMQGANVDQNAMGHGPFGISLTNPIPVNGPVGEILYLYLSALRVRDKRLLFHRIKSTQAIDAFECCSIDGSHWGLLFLDMYHPRKSRKAADGYRLAQKNVLLSGINQEIADFPRALYPAIVEYSKKRFGMSIADPEIRLAIEKIEFERPESHLAQLRKFVASEAFPDASVISKDSDDVKLGIHVAYMILPQLCLFDESWSSIETAKENLRRRRLPPAHDSFSVGYLVGFTYAATKSLEVAFGNVAAEKIADVISTVFLELFGALNGPLLQSKIQKLEGDFLFQRGMNAGAADADGTRSGGMPLQWARYLFNS